jgi:uncharacterized protein (TIGR00369 family)
MLLTGNIDAPMSYEFVDQMMEQTKQGQLRSPVSETLDMRLVEFARGEAVYEMAAREELGNPLGVIQGGVATALADAAMAAATTTILTDEEIQKSAITTIDIFARFIRPVNAKKIELLRAEAKVVRAGGRLVWAEADVLADGEVVGKFASTGASGWPSTPSRTSPLRGPRGERTRPGGHGPFRGRRERRPRARLPRAA